jgi:lysophospholipid acyltransferase (LPLAT)-like uncharacterized protein
VNRQLLFWIIGHGGWRGLWLVYKTLRVKLVNHEVIGELQRQNQNYVLVWWHGKSILGFYLHRQKKINVLMSLGRDGDVLAGMSKQCGCEPIPGSSGWGGEEATQSMMEAAKNWATIHIAADGPAGPRHKLKIGCSACGSKSAASVGPGIDARREEESVHDVGQVRNTASIFEGFGDV